MLDGPDLVYLYDGTFEGLLSAVFESYARKQRPLQIVEKDTLQQTFTQQLINIDTDIEKFDRVRRGIIKKMDTLALQKVLAAFLSYDENKDTKIYKYLVLGFEIGRKIHDSLVHKDVLPIEDIFRHVTTEKYQIIQFIRFSSMENGVYFARINPKNSVIPLIMDHFTDRFNSQPFVIYDEVHCLAGVYDTKTWYMVPTEGVQIPTFTDDDRQYRRMWKTFYDTIAIEERINFKRRMNFMPKRFWRNMTEMNYLDTTDKE